MKKLINIFTMVIVANVIGLGATVCNAQLGGDAPLPEIKKSSGPSLGVTTKWITNKFAAEPPFLTKMTSNIYVAAFDDCEMTFSSEITNTVGKNTRVLTIYLKLQDMDADSIYSNGYGWFINSLGGLKVVRQIEFKNTSFDNKEYINKYSVKGDNLPPNEDYKHWAERSLRNDMNFRAEVESGTSMTNAFKHAIELCQQNAANEKAAKPTKKKDLF